MEDIFFSSDTRDYVSKPMSKDDIEESISRILFLTNDKKTDLNMLVGVLAISYHCSHERILDAVNSLVESGDVLTEGNDIILLNGGITMYKSLNEVIRLDIEDFMDVNGPQDTRFLIDYFAKKYSTKRQRISGNLSAMAKVFDTITIQKNPPHSIACIN